MSQKIYDMMGHSWYAGPAWFGIGPWGAWAGILFFAVIVWSLVWKGLALWKAAREGSKPWFVALLIINTLGILEILYLFVFSRRPKKPEALAQ